MAAPGRIVIASGNPGKLRELTVLLQPWAVQLVPQRELGVPDADETGATFAENALIKARHAVLATGLPAIADDSGIEVDALGGAPGVHSARFAGPGASDADNLRLLLQRAREAGAVNSPARFLCVMVYVAPGTDAPPVIARGAWDGHLVAEPRGRHGFGYDPVFFVPEQGCTSAELAPALKNRISHRARASAALLAQLRTRFDAGAVPAARGAG